MTEKEYADLRKKILEQVDGMGEEELREVVRFLEERAKTEDEG